MDDINRNIENLVDSVDYLVEYLERTKREESDTKTDFSSLELTKDIKGFEKYLKTIQENTSQLKDIKQSLNAYFQNIDVLQPQIETIEEQPLNSDLDQNHFIEIQNEIKMLVEKIGDLTNTLNQSNVKLDIEINPQNLEQIKQQLEDLKISPQINFDGVLTQLEEIKKNFDSLQNLDIKNVDFEILNIDKIESIIEKISEFKNLSIGFKEEDINNITKLEETLQSLKEIDFKNLESLKNIDDLKSIDFETIVEKMNSLKDIDLSNLTLDIEVKEDIIKKVDGINTKIFELKDNLANIDFTSDLIVNLNTDKVKDNIREDLKNVDVTIKPNIDLSELEAINEKEYKIKIKAEIDDKDVTFKEVPLKTIQVENNKSDNNDKLILEQLNSNNETLKRIAFLLQTSKTQVLENNITTTVVPESENKSITQITPIETKVDPNMVMLQTMTALLEKAGLIHLELLKSRFSDDSPLLGK